ncbi:putative transcription factor WD40-like family [Helianthus anomalus]
MLTRREIAPRIKKHVPRRHRGRNFDLNHRRYVKPNSESARDSRRELLSWVEAESLGWLSAKYCSLMPSPRSTIAAAFSPDGKILASTHGDHTVKIIDCQTGKCLKVLSGHRRTPWVVRFNPLHPEILASGSLDHEVRLWNANTSECIRSRDFYRPIASIAFHSEGELLAVAAGHKLYLWQYNSRGETTSPAIILRTRRSLRAVHFHPHAAPLLLTAEVISNG